MSEPTPQPAQPAERGPEGFLAWFPWEKILIWGLFLLLVYVLRHFFFIIFMTFLITYIMSGLVKRVMHVLSPRRERPWLQRGITVVGFALLLGLLYGVGRFLFDPLRSQAQGLVSYAQSLGADHKRLFEVLLAKTVGAWRFEALYHGEEGQRQLREDLEKFRKDESRSWRYDDFLKSLSEVEQAFKESVIREEGAWRTDQLAREGRLEEAVREWLLAQAPGSPDYASQRPALEREWQQHGPADLYVKRFPRAEMSYEQYLKSKLFEEDREQELMRRFVERELNAPGRMEFHVEQYSRHLGEQAYEELLHSGEWEDRFRGYYAGLALPFRLGPHIYSYEKFQELRRAAAESREAFEALTQGEVLTPEEREKRSFDEFRMARQEQLAEEAIKEVEFLQIENIRRWIAERVPDFTRWVTSVTVNLFELIVEFGLCLLLSFFITFDMPRLRRGIRKLEQSRVRDFYHEIAPGLVSFGRLIGRAFQAQGVIALCNTLLTFGAIKLLGIQNEIFLCAIVFICSFIPVLGVVLSSVPIAVMAMIQKEVPGVYPEGDFWLALWAILAIVIIHFIEASILNPTILGDMLHLHPVMVLGILAVGEYFFGIWGLLLGVPVAVYVIRYVILAEEMEGQPAGAGGRPNPVFAPASPRPSRPAGSGSSVLPAASGSASSTGHTTLP